MPEVRLVNGPSMWQGRVEIYHNGVWGTVCDDFFGREEAEVICRQMGASRGFALTDCQYGEGTGQILLDDLMCIGSETRLDECEHRGWGTNNCGHQEDASVNCGKYCSHNYV